MRSLLFVVAFLSACTGTQRPPDEGLYQFCQSSAIARANREADRLCPPERVKWENCKDREMIMGEMKSAQEDCRK